MTIFCINFPKVQSRKTEFDISKEETSEVAINHLIPPKQLICNYHQLWILENMNNYRETILNMYFWKKIDPWTSFVFSAWRRGESLWTATPAGWSCPRADWLEGMGSPGHRAQGVKSRVISNSTTIVPQGILLWSSMNAVFSNVLIFVCTSRESHGFWKTQVPPKKVTGKPNFESKNLCILQRKPGWNL